jgi:hypothetical protein
MMAIQVKQTLSHLRRALIQQLLYCHLSSSRHNRWFKKWLSRCGNIQYAGKSLKVNLKVNSADKRGACKRARVNSGPFIFLP